MHFISKHKSLLIINFSLLVIFSAVLSFNVSTRKHAELLLAQSVEQERISVEHIVASEQRIQNKPEEAHTVEEQQIPVFVYHSVRPHIPNESKSQELYDITPELLEEQLIYLRDNGYHVMTPKDLFADSKTGKVVTLVTKPVMLTFDDGWKNQYEYAYPLLKKYNVKAVIYIYTKPLGAPKFLTWDEIKEMRDGGMVIGSHTLTHPHMKKLSDAVLHKEIFDSKKILEEKLGSTIDDFATPYGYSDTRIEEMAKSAGYRTSRTLYKSSYHKSMFSLKGYLVRDTLKDFIFILHNKN